MESTEIKNMIFHVTPLQAVIIIGDCPMVIIAMIDIRYDDYF